MPTLIPEAFGLTVTEALSKGVRYSISHVHFITCHCVVQVPVIGSLHGALPELVGRDGKLGVVTDDIEKMSLALHFQYNRTHIYNEARMRFNSTREVIQLLEATSRIAHN
jgi:glycosyltransferase involved in cell wall biosynthesis